MPVDGDMDLMEVLFLDKQECIHYSGFIWRLQ